MGEVIVRIDESKDVTKVRTLLGQWEKICHGSQFGLAVSVAGVERDLQARLDLGDGVLLIAYDGIEPVGFFAVFKGKSSLSDQTLAVETFWFALPNRKLAGPALFHAAKAWAKSHGCTHLVVSASRLASDLHDKVCSFCEKVGMKPFETVYICVLE